MFGKSLKIAFFFFLIPLFSLNAQENSVSTVVSESDISLSDSENSISLEIDENSANSSEPSAVWAFVKMILVLAVIIACIYGVFIFFRKSSNSGNSDDPFLRKVSQISLSPGKSVQVVTLLDNAYLIGVTDNSINLIGQVTDKELVEAMNVYSDKNSRIEKPRTFSDVLDIFLQKGHRSENVFADSSAATDSLKKQRANFNSSDIGE